jgi:hypothetical protein
MWYAFWMLSLALIAGIIATYAVRREDKEKAREGRTPAQPPTHGPEEERGQVVSLKHASEEKRFSDSNLPPFLREGAPATPVKAVSSPKKVAPKKPATKKAVPRKKTSTKKT